MSSLSLRKSSKGIYLILLLGLVLAFSSVFVSSAQDMAYHESPMLTAKVEAGELPPLEERLPAVPAVVTPLEEVGTYGGEMRVGFTGTNPGWGGLWFIAGWENLVIWKPDFSGVDPNIIESWEVSEDASEYTFHLREGLKWSDGVPYTADDIAFYIEDILQNPDISPGGVVADWLPRDMAEGFQFEKVDDYTVKFIFPSSYGTFLFTLAQWNGRDFARYPKHYGMQFHAAYADAAELDAMVAAEDGVEDWIGLFDKKNAGPTSDTQGYFDLPEKPVLYPWMVTQTLGAGTTMRMERNPYYFKVDTEGNQLPYVDAIIGVSYQDGESRTFAMLNGELDFIKDPGGDNRILYFDAVDQGAPLVLKTQVMSDGGTTHTIHFNRNAQDPALAEIFANKDFRIGMSYAINREEIIEIVNFGQGTPSQAAPLESSPLYNEQLATQYTEFDLDLANEYLDKVMPDKDADGYRLLPNGERFSAVFSVSNDLSYGTNWEQVAELLIGYWDEVGVSVTMNSMADEQFADNRDENNLEITIYTGEGGAGLTGILDPRYYVPGELFGMYGNGWYYWRTNNSQHVQVEMPEDVLAIRQRYENEVLAGASQDAQIAAMQELLQVAADEFWVVGIARPGPNYYPHHERLHGLPESWIDGWIEGVQKIYYPEQWYIVE